MARAEWTPGGARIRGKVGNLQYRSIAGKDYVSRAPDMSHVQWTPRQLAQRGTFRACAAWGRAALADPPTREAYLARSRALHIPIYALIYMDWRHGPRVDAIDTSGYTGKAGQEIRIRVDDAFEGFRVNLSIRDGPGNLVESGPASRTAPDQVEWIYRTNVDLASTTGVFVEAEAQDRPGKRATRIVRLT